MQMLRLDIACVQNNLVESRNKALELILKSKVCINGKICQKASQKVSKTDKITLLESPFVSRAGEKMHTFLAKNPNILENIKDKNALDIGASTGGFTQVLLQNGVKSVVCVDVGSEQLHKTLREDCRVKVLEKTDIRDFAKESNKFPLVVCDVSFISLKDILDSILLVSSDILLLLFKPQFEVGIHTKRSKKGVVLDGVKIKEALECALELLGHYFRILTCVESSIKGKEGNVEFFIACARI